MIIIGLDGLDYTFAQASQAQHLLQKYRGTCDVPIDPITEIPITPQVWGSFLTGLWDAGTHFTTGNPWRDRLRHVLIQLKKKLPWISLGLGRSIGVQRIRHFSKLQYRSFVDRVNIALYNVPFYNLDMRDFANIHRITDDIAMFDEVCEDSMTIYRLRKLEIFEFLEATQGHRFIYLQQPDHFHHLHPTGEQATIQFYQDLDQFVAKIKNKIGEFETILIVSDHGFDPKTKEHSFKGFWSCSHPIITPTPKKVTDFYDILVREL